MAASAPDWKTIANSPEFRELEASRRRFIVPATIFYCGWFIGVLVLYGYAPDTMAEPVIGSISLGLLLGASVVLVTVVMAFLYERKSREWTRLIDRIAGRAS